MAGRGGRRTGTDNLTRAHDGAEGQTGRGRPARYAGTLSLGSDQPAAVRLKQGDTRRKGHRQARRHSRDDTDAGQELHIKDFAILARGGGGSAHRGAGDNGRVRHLTDRLGGDGRQAAFGHAAITRLVAAAALLLRHQAHVHRRHLRERGAESQEQEPDEAFHARGTDSQPGRPGNCLLSLAQ